MNRSGSLANQSRNDLDLVRIGSVKGHPSQQLTDSAKHSHLPIPQRAGERTSPVACRRFTTSPAPIHAELKLDDAIVIVEQAAPGHTPSPVVDLLSSRAPVLCLGDDDAVDALFERARAAGADVLREPETTEWGNRRFEVLDPEGHQWSVGSYQPGASWS